MGGAEDVGLFSLALAVTTPIVMLCNLSLRTVYVTSLRSRMGFAIFWRLRLISVLPVLILSLVIGSILDPEPEKLFVILLLALAKIFEAGSDMIYALPQRVNRLAIVGQSMIVRAVFSLVSFAVVYSLSGSLVYSLLAYAGVWALVLIVLDYRIIARQYLISDQQVCVDDGMRSGGLWSLVRLAFPMGLASFLIALAIQAPRYVIEAELGTYDLGIFASLGFFLLTGNLVINVLGQTVRAPLAQAFTVMNVWRFWSVIGAGSMLAVLLGLAFYLCAVWLGEFVLLIVYGPSFSEHAALFVLLGLVSIPFYLGGFWGFCLSATGAYWSCLVAALLALFVSFLGAAYLVPTYGLDGGVYATGLFGLATCCQILLIAWAWFRQISHSHGS